MVSDVGQGWRTRPARLIVFVSPPPSFPTGVGRKVRKDRQRLVRTGFQAERRLTRGVFPRPDAARGTARRPPATPGCGTQRSFRSWASERSVVSQVRVRHGVALNPATRLLCLSKVAVSVRSHASRSERRVRYQVPLPPSQQR
jgi:hypothetical protein